MESDKKRLQPSQPFISHENEPESKRYEIRPLLLGDDYQEFERAAKDYISTDIKSFVEKHPFYRLYFDWVEDEDLESFLDNLEHPPHLSELLIYCGRTRGKLFHFMDDGDQDFPEIIQFISKNVELRGKPLSFPHDPKGETLLQLSNYDTNSSPDFFRKADELLSAIGLRLVTLVDSFMGSPLAEFYFGVLSETDMLAVDSKHWQEGKWKLTLVRGLDAIFKQIDYSKELKKYLAHASFKSPDARLLLFAKVSLDNDFPRFASMLDELEKLTHEQFTSKHSAFIKDVFHPNIEEVSERDAQTWYFCDYRMNFDGIYVPSLPEYFYMDYAQWKGRSCWVDWSGEGESGELAGNIDKMLARNWNSRFEWDTDEFDSQINFEEIERGQYILLLFRAVDAKLQSQGFRLVIFSMGDDAYHYTVLPSDAAERVYGLCWGEGFIVHSIDCSPSGKLAWSMFWGGLWQSFVHKIRIAAFNFKWHFKNLRKKS